jgi:hypothetical protein
VTGYQPGSGQVFPHQRQVFLFHAEQIDALAAGHLHLGHMVLVAGIGNRAQLVRLAQPAEHAWHHRIRAVLLDVAVCALVDETRLRVIFILAGPVGEQVVIQGRAAGRTAIRGLPFQELAYFPHGLEAVLLDRRDHLVVAVLGAFAQRLAVSGLVIAFTHRAGQQCLDQPGTGTAGTGGLGMCTHVFQREQALLADGIDDVALADTVAAADLGGIRQRHHARLGAVTGIAQVVLAKQDGLAEVRDAGTFTHQLEIPAAIDGVTIQHRALDAVVVDHQLLVGAGAGVGEHQHLVAFGFVEFSRREQVDAGDLEFGGGDRALVACIAQSGQLVGRDLALFKQWRDQAVGYAAMLGAFADRIDARIVGLHDVVDHDTAFAIQPGAFRQRGVGHDADTHHHQVGRNLAAILETHAGHAPVTEYLAGLRFHQKGHAALLQ